MKQSKPNTSGAIESSARASAWRGDLEGLRVIAIVLVASYHIWFERVSGGVDIFLMLSGFFVGGSLWRRFAYQKPPKAREYLARQLRRLLPAAITVLAATLVAAIFFLPITQWRSSAWQTLASLTYWENWYLFANNLDYAAADQSSSPWQQFWSLSIQGQFFLAVPLVMALGWVLSRRWGRGAQRVTVTVLLATLTVASFAYAVWFVSFDQTLAYFDTFSRGWEFLAGTLLAILLGRWRPSSPWWPRLSWPALLVILLVGIAISGREVFPGPWTLVPIGAAALLVVAGTMTQDSGAARLMGSKLLAPAAKYAYSLYLWHWPVLIFVTMQRDRPVGWLAGTGVFLLSAGLAVITYHLVEAPLRYPRKLGRRWWQITPSGAFVMLAGTLVLVASAGWLGNLVKHTFDFHSGAVTATDYPGGRVAMDPEGFQLLEYRMPQPLPEIAEQDYASVFDDGCVTGDFDDGVLDCSYVDGSGLRVAVLGGSHSLHWWSAIFQLAEEEDWTLVPLLKSGCRAGMPQEDSAESACGRWQTNVLPLVDSGQFDLIITNSTRPNPDAPGDYVPDYYLQLFEALSPNTPIIAMRDVPWFSESLSEAYLKDPDWKTSIYDYISVKDPTDELTGLQNIHFMEVNDLVCPRGICQPVIGNVTVYRDADHLTDTYVRSISDEMVLRWRMGIEQLGLKGPSSW